jgi:chitin disaccharide deacetylase
MNKLIINADDFGLCESVNRGIIDCYLNGLVSDMSFLINCDCFDASVEMLRKAGIHSTGIHFNLTLGTSFTGRSNSIADTTGKFFQPKALFIKYLTGTLKDEEIYKELKAQLNLLISTGIEVTHFDSHQNVHLIPIIYRQMNLLMEEYKKKVNIRIPSESVRKPFSCKPSNLKRILILKTLSSISRPYQNRKSRIYAIGGDFFNNENPAIVFNRILTVLETDMNRIFELAVHPGYFSEIILQYDPYGRERETELSFLRSMNKQDLAHRIQITNFENH